MQTPSIGEVFEGRYEIRNVLGQGGFATVYLVWDTRTQRDVVLKLLSPDKDGTYPPTVRARFEREAQIFATLDEPHIVTMYDFGRSADGMLYMVFENVAGRDLLVLMAMRKLAPNVVQRIVIQLLEALREAHKNGVLHRDIKPANVLIYEYGGDPYRVKLIDFGIAKDTAPNATRLTQTGNVVGTLRYMSPEQVFGEPLTPATDVFCLGMVAWEMLMGRPLIAGADHKSMLQEHAALRVVDLPPIPSAPQLREAVLRALAVAPEDRFASADAMLTALRTPLTPAPLQGRKVEGPEQTTSIPKWAGASIVAVITIAAAAAFLGRDEDPTTTRPPTSERTLQRLTRIDSPDASQLAKVPDMPTDMPDMPQNMADMADMADMAPRIPADEPTPCRLPAPFEGNGVLGNGLVAYIPASYDPQNPPALIVGLHRQMFNGTDFLRYTGITEYADRNNWVVIVPESKANFRRFGWPEDITYVVNDIDVALSELCIDRTRLHIIGDEGGAAHAQRIACELPVSSVVASFAQSSWFQCEPNEPTPYMRLHTLQDTIHPPSGRGCAKLIGKLSSWTSIERVLLEQASCPDAKSSPWEAFPDACKQYPSCPVPVVGCGFDGGHRWPESTVQPDIYFGCVDDPATNAPLMGAAAEFIMTQGRALTPEQIAVWDAAREKALK